MPNDTEEAIALERQLIAEEVASAFLTLYGSADKAEGVLDRYFALRDSYDKEFWREVITAIAQARG